MMTKEKLQEEYQEHFQTSPEHIFFCPGRINLIGEHIDYNGGKVMPCAISMGTYLAIGRNTDKRLRLHCLNFPETADLHLQSSYTKAGDQWFNYPLGVVNSLLQSEYPLSGLGMLFYGNLPIGAGLSSSASIEVVTAYAVSEMFELNISLKDIALLSKEVENTFIGVNCGIMDQFAVAMGKKDNAILLNCDSLEYEYLPFQTSDYSLVIINTNKQRTLADSKYNERFAECGAALQLLKQELDIQNLCEIDRATFERHRHLINNAVLEKRALHVITENERVKVAAEALKMKDVKTFGNLMYASHGSLKNDYVVSGIELDTVVDLCRNYEGCIGARMTGAGFGGCAIALVKAVQLEDFTELLIDNYKERIGYSPEVLISGIGDGVREL
ncbi:MAG TPA: galactokinase [Flavitalea sp.]|nr:galactokinase [Flavitalea sp.]